MEEVILNAEVIDDLATKGDSKEAAKVIKILVGRLRTHGDISIFRQLSERLEEIRARAEQGLITSIQFIKELCQIGTETLQAEKQYEPMEQIASGKTALTELFLEMKTDQTPAIVDRIVNDIDEIVRVVRFEGWQSSIQGERLVQKSLRKTLLKYQLHRDTELFNKAYEYIKEYY